MARAIGFTRNDHPTLGVEVELQLVDKESLALTSTCAEILSRVPKELAMRFKPELIQSCLEINTEVCRDVAEVRTDLQAKLSLGEKIAAQVDTRFHWAGTHPFSSWQDQRITHDERYEGLVVLLQDTARRLNTFGLHVHVGVESGDKAVMICERLMNHLPTLLALSANSPFWSGRATGLASQRIKIMDNLPTAGLPPLMRNWSEYVWLVNHLLDTGFINTIREIWWDIRPHHNFGTVEVRVCDMPGNLDDVLSLAALVQSLVKALSDEIDNGAYQHDCHPMMVRQNKWRACRYGTRAMLVNSYTYEVQSVSDTVRRLIERLRPTADSLGCLAQLEKCQAIADRPDWGARQRMILSDTGDPREIVRQLLESSRISEL